MFCKIGLGLRAGAMVEAVWNELSRASRLQVMFMTFCLVDMFQRTNQHAVGFNCGERGGFNTLLKDLNKVVVITRDIEMLRIDFKGCNLVSAMTFRQYEGGSYAVKKWLEHVRSSLTRLGTSSSHIEVQNRYEFANIIKQQPTIYSQ